MYRRYVTASSTEEADQDLNAVSEELQHLARTEVRTGIRVTKTGPGQFTLELSDDVPYGLTREAAV
jgi:hypothetical protein